MIKYVLGTLGWLMVLVTGFNILVKLFGSDAAVLRYAGTSRDIDTPTLGFAIALIFLGISKVLWKPEELDERLDSLDEE